ncbi:hypothetical protein Dimus_006763 [Dionaea muscipula]
MYPNHYKSQRFFGGSILNAKTVALGSNGSYLSLLRRPTKARDSKGLKVVDPSTENGLGRKVDEEKASVVYKMEDLNPCGSGNLPVHQDKHDKNSVPRKRSEIGEERDEKALSSRILSLCRTNKMKSALVLFKSLELSGLQPGLHACNALLSGLLRNNMVDHALHVFQFMKANAITSGHSYSLVLKAVASGYGIGAALKMFRELESESREDFDAIVYNTVLSVCGRENDWVQMERIWNSMQKNGLSGTPVTYRLLVCTFVRCGKNELATDAYDEMLQIGLRPAGDAMQAVIGAYANEGNTDLALDVFQDMLNSNLKPNLVACNTVINSLGKSGNVKAAFEVYDLMRGLGQSPDTYTWNGLLGAYYHSKRYANALKLYDIIEKDKIVVMNEQLYHTALKCCRGLRLWEKALQIFWRMEESGVCVSNVSFNLVIGVCEAARKPEIAFQVYEHMVHEKCAPDTFTYLSLIRCCIWGSLWTELEKILEMTTPNVSAYNAVIHGMCLRGKTGLAKKMYRKMKELGLTPDGKTRAMMLQFLQEKSAKS